MKLDNWIGNVYYTGLKKERENINLGTIDSRITLLKEYWTKFCQSDEHFKSLDHKAFKDHKHILKKIHWRKNIVE